MYLLFSYKCLQTWFTKLLSKIRQSIFKHLSMVSWRVESQRCNANIFNFKLILWLSVDIKNNSHHSHLNLNRAINLFWYELLKGGIYFCRWIMKVPEWWGLHFYSKWQCLKLDKTKYNPLIHYLFTYLNTNNKSFYENHLKSWALMGYAKILFPITTILEADDY